MLDQKHPSSFRDPSGFLFVRDGSIYRQVNQAYKENYDHLMRSGLYEALLKAELLIPHSEVDAGYAQSDKAYKIIKPEPVQFVSYPYEWCFSELKDAALVTLDIQQKAFDFGMSLKDCSAYNIQFRRCKPILIDTLSFEKYAEGRPWVAYRQFCQHFLAPLALMSYRDVRLSQLLQVYIDGVPLDLASSLLPFSTRFRFSLLSHIHLHARSQRRFADRTVNLAGYKVSRLAFLGLVDNLKTAIQKLSWKPGRSEWGNYYEDTNYSPRGFEHKKQLVADFLRRIQPRCVWDLGGNIGVFSRIASGMGIPTISFDVDPAAVEKNYRECVQQGEGQILPLVLDLTNPSKALGWANEERQSFFDRASAEAVLALALIHHLAISNNVPFDRLVDFFGRISRHLVIEFVPKSDSQVQRLLATREDIFEDYSQASFEQEFGRRFKIAACEKIADSERSLYLMERR